MASSKDKLSQHYSSIPVQVKTVLRIRPFLKRERDDQIVLNPLNTTTVVMAPQPAVQMLSPSSALVKQTIDPENNYDQEFYFDHVLGSNTTQEDMYFSFGSNTAQQAMEPLKAAREKDVTATSLIIAMGLSNSGKTFSCWGDHCLPTQKLPQDGMLPRILDSLFSQSTHFVEKKTGRSFGVQISIVQVGHRDGLLSDLLKSPSRRSIRSTISSFSTRQRNGNSPFPNHTSVMIEQDPLSLKCRLKNNHFKVCFSCEEARATLRKAVKIRHDTARPGHVFIQLQPVMVNRSHKVVEEGGRIAVLEMESLDNGKKLKAGRIKDSIPNRVDAYASVMQCLRVALDNQNDPSHAKNVPFVQHKVTMLLQGLFAPETTDSTNVTVLVTAYPGDRDYVEKKELLNDLQPLREKNQTNSAVTGISSAKSKCVREHKSHRKHSHDYSSGGARRAVEERSFHTNGALKVPSSSVEGNIACVPKHPNHNISTRDIEKSVDDILPFPPPPVAPGYKHESMIQHGNQHSRNILPHSVALNRPSAPLEEKKSTSEPSHVLPDFPGVKLPRSMIAKKTKRDDTFDFSRRPTPTTAEAVTDTKIDNDMYINLISDKNDTKIDDPRMIVSLPHFRQRQVVPSTRPNEYHTFGIDVDFLCKENEKLRAENERLRRECACLKQSLENNMSHSLRQQASHATASMDRISTQNMRHVLYPNDRTYYASCGTKKDFRNDPLSSDLANLY